MAATISIVIPYRDRPAHMACLLAWMRTRGLADRDDIEVIVVEGDRAPTDVRDAVESAGARYEHLACSGPFSKTGALNVGLAVSAAPWIMAWDVDLVPVGDTFERHVAAASSCPGILITGHRLMSSRPEIWPHEIADAAARATLAPEDTEVCVIRHLLRGERFGVNPVFHRDRLQAIGGWDGAYVGWGGEDQDVLERYTAESDVLMVRAPDLVYLHMWHGQAREWSEFRYVSANRQRYYHWRRDRD